MNNRPFFSTNTNVYDQSVFSAAPSNLNGQHVLVSQEQQQKLFDTLNTSVVGLPFTGSFPVNNQCPPQFLQAQKQFVPGGVVFSFNLQPPVQPQGYMMQQISCPSPSPNGFYPASLEQQIAATGLQKHGLGALQYQQHLADNPFQLKFHHNSSTSCSDLPFLPAQLPSSRTSPDFTNISGVVYPTDQEQRNNYCSKPSCDWLAHTFPNTPTMDPPRNTKTLDLSHPPEKPQGRVADLVEPDNSKSNETKKKVCFEDEVNPEGKKEDKSSQISCRCKCNGKETESKSKQKKKSWKLSKKKKKEEPESSNESSDEDTLSCCYKEEKTKKKPQDKSDSQYSSTEVSE